MTRANVIILIAIAAISAGIWAMINRPAPEPPWPTRTSGFAFSPMRAEHDPVQGRLPDAAQIDADLALFAGTTDTVRTYYVEGAMGEVPALAHKRRLGVVLGAWISADLERNERELARLIKLARAHRNVTRVIIGNEVLLRGELGIEQLTGYLDRAREALDVPVSTAEPWHVWLRHRPLAGHVDFLAVHMLPYWEGIALDNAVGHITDRTRAIREAFPGKPVVLGEVGWPSKGRQRGEAVASLANQAKFLRRFLAHADKEGYEYFIMEAFDQPWKRTSEGAVGAYWGVYDVERQPKFKFIDPVVRVPHWKALAAISALVAAITLTLLLTDSRTLRRRGRSFLAVIAFVAATLAVWVVYDYTNQYLTLPNIIIAGLLVVGMMGVLLVLLTEAHEWAEAQWLTEHRRAFRPLPMRDEDLPVVSIHVPAYNEPPEMMIETLDALARLDYPDYEVLVIDNNTRDPAVWEPVQAHCEKLGPRFCFFHVDPLAGFKAGALNYALRHTRADAAIVAVIDSDYVVEPSWLRDLAPQFTKPSVAIVQAPQDYRDAHESAFKAMCYGEYRGFFYIGMITRNERNAIIQHGTMTLVRRAVLEGVGGWAEWCITEDAELGLRIFAQGYEAEYIPRSYGRGFMPDTFDDFKKQRFRWAYGAVQIMRHHAGALTGRGATRLTWGQRYHFLAGWLPWLADGLNLFFTLAALAWSAAMVLTPRVVDPPPVVFSLLPIAFFTFKGAKLFYLYQSRVRATVAQTLAAGLAGLALSHTIALAMVKGFVTRGYPFLRTPKRASSSAVLKALGAARGETLLMLSLWLAAVLVGLREDVDSLDLLLWIVVLLIQSLPYAAALVVSLLSGLPRLSAQLIGAISAPPSEVPLDAPAGNAAQHAPDTTARG